MFFHKPELEEPFHMSEAFLEGVTFIENGGKLLCLVGPWGSGKTSTAKQVYGSVIKSPPIIIHNSLTFSLNDRPLIFDTAISKEITDVEKDQFRDKIKTLYENLSRFGRKQLIIITLNEDMEHCHDFVRSLTYRKEDTMFINLSEKLTKNDRIEIFLSHFKTFSRNTDFSKVKHLALANNEHSLGYPEICALFSRCTAFQNICPIVFSCRPLHHLKSHFKKMHESKENEKFLLLVYMSMNQMEINITAPNETLFEILRSCSCGTSENESDRITTQMESTKTTKKEDCYTENDVCSGTKPKNICKNKEYVKSLLSKEFIIQEAETSSYKLQHEVIQRMVLIVFGTYHFDKLLQYSKQAKDLKGWIQKKSYFRNLFTSSRDSKPVLEINGEQWRQIQRKLNRASS